jgi:PAS domain S-box-containing protein
LRIQDVLLWYSERNRYLFLAIAGLLVLAIALADARVESNVGLGFLYLLPILLASPFLRRWHVLLLAMLCALLREAFGPFGHGVESLPRLVNVGIAFLATGIVVQEITRRRQMVQQHLQEMEQQVALRREVEEQLRVLVESSPAAILTLDGDGKVLLANEAAHQMLAYEGRRLEGEDITQFLPVLCALQGTAHKSFRTAIEARGRRRDGEIFLAHIWFSTYNTSSGMKVAAIVLDASEELRDREESGLDGLLKSSRILVGAVSHEIRNLCGAIAVVHANLARVPELAENEDFVALANLIEALRKIATAELRPAVETRLAGTTLQPVFDDLRIIIGAALHESGIELVWELPADLPAVRAERQRLLQVFLNLTQNSQRALEDSEVKQLRISAACEDGRVVVRFQDTGPGVAHPERLFRPFQQGAEVAGLGLYVSRAIMRAFAGDLRYETQDAGACFAVELARADNGGHK